MSSLVSSKSVCECVCEWCASVLEYDVHNTIPTSNDVVQDAMHPILWMVAILKYQRLNGIDRQTE